MTPAARVATDIDGMLLRALMDQTPIPRYRVDGLVAYVTARHPTVPRDLIETVLPGILAAHVARARAAGDVYLQETELLLAELRRRQAARSDVSEPE
jgi:hypothetical protein